MRKIYIAGNPIIKEDSLPTKIADRLRKDFPWIEFREIDPTDEMPEERELNIIDTVIGPSKVEVIRDIDKIVTGKVYSLHDFDLGFNLKLMKKTGRIDSVNIIGIPAQMDEENALRGTEAAIKKMFPKTK